MTIIDFKTKEETKMSKFEKLAKPFKQDAPIIIHWQGHHTKSYKKVFTCIQYQYGGIFDLSIALCRLVTSMYPVCHSNEDGQFTVDPGYPLDQYITDILRLATGKEFKVTLIYLPGYNPEIKDLEP